MRIFLKESLTPYEFVVIQNGKELDIVYGMTQKGTDVYKYIFSEPGPVEIRIEDVGDFEGKYSEFSTIVYPNPKVGVEGEGLTGSF